MSVNIQSMTISDLIRPSKRSASFAYTCALVLAGSALLALSARFSFYLPFSPVPVTGQTFAVLFIGALYGSKRGAMTVAAYICEGAIGLPVFAGGAFGLVSLVGPTGGYLFGFVAATYLTGRLAEKSWDRNIFGAAAMMLLGEIVLFTFGVFWLSRYIGSKAIVAGLVPFIPGEVVKMALASVLLPSGWKVLKRR